MTKKKAEIKIDVTDWADKALKLEDPPQTQEDIADMAVEQQLGARETGEIAIGSRAIGISPEDILPADKALLSEGGAMTVHHMVANMKRRIEVNGREIEVRYATAVGSREQDDDRPEEDDLGDVLDGLAELPERGYVMSGTEESVANALRLLWTVVVGNIRNRLAEVYVGGGDLDGTADALVAKIGEIVDRLKDGRGDGEEEPVVE